jgi:hypothetical protein
MAHIDHRLVEIPADQRAKLTERVQQVGLNAASRETDLAKSTVSAIIATGHGMPGSAALLREWAARGFARRLAAGAAQHHPTALGVAAMRGGGRPF